MWFGAPKKATAKPYVNFDAFAVCDRCGQMFNQSRMRFQDQWSGFELISTGLLVCLEACYDIPNPQARSIIIPPDPRPVPNARPQQFFRNSYDTRTTQEDDTRIDQDGDTRVTAEFIPEEGYDPNTEQPIATETGDLIITETGNFMITE